MKAPIIFLITYFIINVMITHDNYFIPIIWLCLFSMITNKQYVSIYYITSLNKYFLIYLCITYYFYNVWLLLFIILIYILTRIITYEISIIVLFITWYVSHIII